jgi:hypothetical protein
MPSGSGGAAHPFAESPLIGGEIAWLFRTCGAVALVARGFGEQLSLELGGLGSEAPWGVVEVIGLSSEAIEGVAEATASASTPPRSASDADPAASTTP